MRNNILFALIATFSLLFMGCSASYQQGFLQKSNHQYSPTRILLITPENGTYGDIVYPTSGNDVITALTQELNRYSPQSISTTYNPIDVQNLPDSDIANFDYIFAPKILHWEDRATGWSFRPDRIEVLFYIYDNQRNLIDTYNIKGRSAYVVWVSKQPNSLLKKPIRNMLADIFGKI